MERLSRKERYEKHVLFREEYTDKQILKAVFAGSVGTFHSIFSMVFLYRFASMHTHEFLMQSIHLFAYSLFILFMAAFFKCCKWENLKAKENYGAFVVISGSVAYICWGFQVMHLSIKAGRTTNYIPLLLLYTLCLMVFYYLPAVYVAFYAFCCSGAVYFFIIAPENKPDYRILVNVFIFGLIITVISIIRYYSDRERFFAERRADEINESKRLFLASMNHELRSPLNGVIGSIQVLRDDASLSSEQRENLNNTYQSAQIMLQIVNDLLDYSKMETKEFAIYESAFDYRDIINSVKQSATATAKSKGLSFALNIPGNTPGIYKGDATRIEQIIINLLTNAVKYTDEGKVSLDSFYENGELVIKVSDTGQGISEEAQKILFSPFVRLNEEKNAHIQGTGLGLSIVKSLVDRMNGTIEVESKLTVGSTFIVRLPLPVEDKDVCFEQVKVIEEVVSDAEDFSKFSILYVDDMKVNLTVFAGLLKKTGIKLTTALSGPAAIDLCNEQKFDLIFTDHQMPDMDGVETFEHIHNESTYNKDTKVIILTANAGSDYEEKYKAIGFDRYMTKPVMKGDLLNVLNEELIG
ncbi:MAG: ATP-binding protein [Lachnospiraceae bacterium]|nr:ATP-binding protein [Lachnospiraceae bacterium]